MLVKPLRPDLIRYARKHGLTIKLTKQIRLFTTNPRHPSLHTEILEPKDLRIYSFRIDRKYRAIFIVTPNRQAEIIDINDHYR
ncbi:MAG: hypothetical protein HY381_01580 [Candidatus Chisholmbacteria bacterium]|nr:hypothetical protein [Candidatus Chisholmbacteria bacterium]